MLVSPIGQLLTSLPFLPCAPNSSPAPPDVTALSPLMASIGNPSPPAPLPPIAFPTGLTTQVMTPLAVDYGEDHCMGCTSSTDGSAVIRLDNLQCRWCAMQ